MGRGIFLSMLVVTEVAIAKPAMPRFVERHLNSYLAQVEEFYRQGQHIKRLIAGLLLSAGLLFNGHFFYQQDLTDQAVADRVALTQLRGDNGGIRFVLPNGDIELARIIKQNSLHHIEVLPFVTYRPHLNLIDYPVDYRPWFANETPLKINIDNVVGNIIPRHVDFRKRVAVAVERSGLTDRYYVDDWIELHPALAEENRPAEQLIGRVFAVFDDGLYGILLFEVRDNYGEGYPLSQKTIVFAEIHSLTFL